MSQLFEPWKEERSKQFINLSKFSMFGAAYQ